MQSPAHVLPRSLRRSGSPVVWAGLVMIAAQLAFRAWAIYGSWFQFDDFSFMSRVLNEPVGEAMTRDYAGHLMPSGFLLTWLNTEMGALDFRIPATELLVMQALADLGALVFLVSAFGARKGILAPLAIFLSIVISLPAFIWWAAGINQLPFLAALFWGGWAHLNYLRTRRFRFALLTMLITVLSLSFYEKTLLIFVLYAFLALAYFATGDIVARLKSIVRSFTPGVVLYSAVVVVYLVVYVLYGLNFDPDRTNQPDLGPVFGNIVARAYATGALGGPLAWEFTTDLFAVAAPTQIVTLVALGVIAVLVYELAQTRVRAKRALLLVAAFLLADVLLVAGARVSFVGPVIALDYRYQTELAAITAIALGLAAFPLRGAVEQVEVTRPSNFLDRTGRVTAATLAVCCLATYSSVTYVRHWQSDERSKTYFTTIDRELDAHNGKVPLVDLGVPDFLMWAFAYPENTYSHVLRMYDDRTSYPDVATDNLFAIADSGRIRPIEISPTRLSSPTSNKGCPYPVKDGEVTIPLDGPVIGQGWWARIEYAAKENGVLTLTMGDRTAQAPLKSGLHALYLNAGSEELYDEIAISVAGPEKGTCMIGVTIGLPTPAAEAPAS